MKTTQHTPGPYKLNEARSNDFLIAITTADETENIGLVYRAPDRAKAIANAQFIMTACNAHHELLEACKAIAALMKQPVQTSGVRQQATCDILRADCRMALNLALNAIQSAQGKE